MQNCLVVGTVAHHFLLQQ
jgi:hypothetical protein